MSNMHIRLDEPGHRAIDDCPCNPTAIPVVQPDGRIDFIMRHNRLVEKEEKKP